MNQLITVSPPELSSQFSLPDFGSWPSPFDDSGVQYAWDSTSLGLLKTCPRKYFLSMVLNWQPKRRSYHLSFGIYFHSAIEHYEKLMALGVDPETGEVLDPEPLHEIAVRSAIRQALIDSWGYEPDPGKNDKTRYNLIRTLVWYFEHYGLNDNCKTVILSNGKPAVELSFRFNIDNDLILCGHLDRIVEFGDGRYVMDHKTAGSTITGISGDYYFKRYNPDNQMTLYATAAAIAFESPVKGLFIDAAQVAVGFSAFARGVTYRSVHHLEEFLQGLYSYRKAAEGFTRQGFWPMNESACGNFGGCHFREVCAKSPLVRDRFLATDFTQDKPWNPLEPR